MTWVSYDETVATVSSSGKVKAVAPGATTVRVKTRDGGFTAKCKVKVVIPVTGLSVTPSSLTVIKGQTAAILAKVSPSSATDKTVTWVSYDETVATVSSAGVVKGKAPGTTTVRAKTKDGGFTAKCKVKVVIPVTGLSVTPTSLTVETGKTKSITAKVSPSSASDKTVTWISYDETIATVSSAGVVKGVKAGSTTVRAKTRDGGFTAKCKVTVKDPKVAVTGLTLDKSSAVVGPGQTLALKATVSPSNATDKTVTWISYDETIATVSSAGVVKGVAEGATTVRAKTVDGGFTAKCKITVKKIGVTGVSVSPSSLSLEVGDTAELTAAVKPANAYYKTVSWKSDDKAVAAVTSKGVVKAVAEGTANITVTTADGGYTAKCAVTVTPSTQSVTKITPEDETLDPMGQVIKVRVKLSAANKDKAVTYKWTVNGGSAKGIIVNADDPVESPATGRERVYTQRVKIADEDRNIVLKVYVDSNLIGTLKYVQKRAAPPSIL